MGPVGKVHVVGRASYSDFNEIITERDSDAGVDEHHV